MQLIQNHLSDWEMAVTEIPVQFRRGIPGCKPQDLAELEDHQTKKRCTGIARHFLVGKVLDISLCDTARIATDRPLVYGKRQRIIQPASASNIPIPRANPAQRCGTRCVEDDTHRRILNEVLTSLTRLIEAHSKGMLCSIFLLDEDGLHLHYSAAANLPEAYRAATDGVRMVRMSDRAAQPLTFVSLSSSLTSLLTRDG
jgi:hypothetical protein